MKLLKAVSLLGLFVLSTCSAKIADYSNTQPTFNLFEYFQGEISAWGIVQDYKGKQIKRFEVKIKGSLLEGNQLKLEEDFIYDTGELETRIWIISKNADGSYSGKAGDVIGEAKGVEVGNALHWQYTLRVKTQQGEIDLTLDDWMFRQDEQHVFNVAKMKKLGIEVGTITLFFKKVPPRV